jgi:preprotein translocase subunit YajC
VTSGLLFAATTKSSGSSSSSLIFLVVILALGGFLFFSSRKRKAASQNMQTQLKVGSSIMTTSGLYAKVVGIADDGVTLEVAPGVYSKYARQAISRVLDAPEGAEPLADDDTESGDGDGPSIDLNKEPPTNP